MVGLIDTNLFKRLTKNVNKIHDGFIRAIDNNIVKTQWVVSPFGWLEYLGLTFRGTFEIPPMHSGWKLPEDIHRQLSDFINDVGLDFASKIYWIRSQARTKYAELLTAAILTEKAEEDRQYHSSAFSQGPLIDPLFHTPEKQYAANSIVELLSIDYLHRYPGFSGETASMVQCMHRSTILAEHYVEKRNVVLFRVFKQAWNSRLKGSNEDQLSVATKARLDRAVNRLKNDADRFDHDLLAYFLLGYAVNGQYEPVTIYTQDSPDEILHRLAIFLSIVSYTWQEWKHLEGIYPIPLQAVSLFRFINDAGEITCQIGFQELTRFLMQEHIFVKR